MEPRQSSPESMSQPAGVNEQAPSAPEVDFQNLEAPRDDHRNEQTERRIGQQIEGATSHLSQPSQAATLPAPVNAGQDDSSTSPATDDDVPIVAADEDLIEKEWVDKAKKVIAETKDDPYRRELEVKRLQLDYVKKRYGKSIGATDDNAWER